MNKFKYTILLSLFSVLVACKTTPETTVDDSAAQNAVQEGYNSLTDFNAYLEYAIQNNDKDFLNEHYSGSKSFDIRLPSRLERAYGTEWQEFIKNSVLNSFEMKGQTGTWDYLGSVEVEGTSNNWNSLYRFRTDESTFAFFELEIDATNYKILDSKNISYDSTTLEFLAYVSDVFHCDIEQAAICDVAEPIKELLIGVRRKDANKVDTAYQSLTQKQKENPYVQDALIRVASLATFEMPVFDSQITVDFMAMNKYPTMLQSRFYQQGHIDAAITSLEIDDERVANDASIMTEQAAMYAEKQDYEKAVELLRTAIYQDANFDLNYSVLLYVSLLNKDYELAMLTIDVLEQKFEYQFTPEILAGIENGDEFVKSKFYRPQNTSES